MRNAIYVSKTFPHSNGRRDRRKMACLIHARDISKTIIMSDSWTTNKDNHITQKVFVGQSFPIIIGTAGDNGIIYPNNKIIMVKDFINDFISHYNGNNYNDCIQTLYKSSYKMIEDLKFEGMNERIVQYFIVLWNYEKKIIESHAYTIVKNLDGIFSYKNNNSLNMDFISFGTYEVEINNDYKYKEIKDVKTEAFHCLNHYINKESQWDNDERRVGGPIQWAYITHKGKLKYNLIKNP